MKKIALMNCYFGKFPWYFDLFIKSCDANPTIDFFIFTDNVPELQIPENVKIIPFTFADFNQLATQKLGFTINVTTGYKLCDFKPAYGFIFSEYLSDYDFWGMCDIDIVFGRIREFMTDELLNKYDIVNARHDFITAYFLLFKNNLQNNTLFTKSKDYQKVFTAERHYCFEECNFRHIQMEQKINIFDVPCEIESMEHIIRREKELGNINVLFDFSAIDAISGKLEWDNGFLCYDNKFEILLFHLIQYKSNILSKKTSFKVIPNIFYIDKYTFRKKSEKTILGLLEFFYYNRFKPFKFKINHFIDYFAAIYFRPRLIAGIETGAYKFTLGEAVINIQNDKKGNNVIVMMNYDSLPTGRYLIQSKFNKTAFFLKGFPNERFARISIKNPKKTIIQRSYLDGNVSSFEVVNDCNNGNYSNALDD